MAGSSNYGTVSQETPAQNGNINAGDEETTALLGSKPSGGSISKRFRKHMSVNVSNSWGDIALLSCYIITGLLDSCAVFIWGSFLSMQTGELPYDQPRTNNLLIILRKHRISRTWSGSPV